MNRNDEKAQNQAGSVEMGSRLFWLCRNTLVMTVGRPHTFCGMIVVNDFDKILCNEMRPKSLLTIIISALWFSTVLSSHDIHNNLRLHNDDVLSSTSHRPDHQATARGSLRRHLNRIPLPFQPILNFFQRFDRQSQRCSFVCLASRDSRWAIS